MPRPTITVSREDFEKAVAEADASSPSTRSELWQKAADIYNRMAAKDVMPHINPSLVALRVKEWGLTLKTPPARIGRKPKNEAKGEVELVEIDSTKTVAEEAVGEAQPAVEPNPQPKQHYVNGPVVLTPAGQCPIKLTDNSEAGIEAWKEAVRQWGQERGINYSDDALRYWLRYP